MENGLSGVIHAKEKELFGNKIINSWMTNAKINSNTCLTISNIY
jgi:hypothetical protein